MFNKLFEMATLNNNLRVKKSTYSIEVHGGNNNERALPPHIHIYGWNGNRKIENIEVSLSEYLETNEFIIIKIDDYVNRKSITNKTICGWDNNKLRLYDEFYDFMHSKPSGKYSDCVDYIDAAIKVWNQETDPKSMGKQYQYVPEKYRIVVAMYLMGKNISPENKRKYFKDIDIDKVIKQYC